MKQLLSTLKSDRGAMDRILVTLLFVIIAVGALAALENWASSQKEDLKEKSETAISNVVNE